MARQFKAPRQLQVPTQLETPHEQKVYQIVYTRDLKKKQKKKFDGVMVLEGNKVTIYDEDSKKIFNGNKSQLEITLDEEILLGSLLVEILQEIPQADFKSGKCFQKQDIAQKICVKVQRHNVMTASSKVKETEFILTDSNFLACKIEGFLGQKMRPHQMQGVKFLFECVTGIKDARVQGAILAVQNNFYQKDSMGLGKTLQAITLIWVLLKQNPISNKSPFIRKVVIVAPLTLVYNWEKEITKWLGTMKLIPLVAIGSKEETASIIKSFTHSYHECLIVSYETFRSSIQNGPIRADLMIFDEGHRLKNMSRKTFQSMASLPCKRRIILTGTPIQNNMREFYSCCDFVNPGILSTYKAFKQIYADPIEKALLGEEVDLELVKERSKELSEIISTFILRRQSNILQQILPSKYEYQIFLKMTPVQKSLYSSLTKKVHQFKDNILSMLTVLRKIITHPDLLFIDQNEITQLLMKHFPQDYEQNQLQYSAKFEYMRKLLQQVKEKGEKIVITSYYSQTLDLVETYLGIWEFKSLRLDGSVANKKRQGIIDSFNNQSNITVFLVNGKSGGAGLNLQSANKIILLDVDWNPANDLQVMGRVWREGQQRECHIYRLIGCGSFEEKILQRQILKEKLSSKIVDEKEAKSMKEEDLKELFYFKSDEKCITYEEGDDISQLEMVEDENVILVKVNKTERNTQNLEIKNEFSSNEVFLKRVDEPIDMDSSDESIPAGSKDVQTLQERVNALKLELKEEENQIVQIRSRENKENEPQIQKIHFNIEDSDVFFTESDKKQWF